MNKFNPIEQSNYINDKYKTYLKSSFYFDDDKLQKKFEEQLDSEDLFKGPYVDLNLEFQKGKNILELIDEGKLCKLFKELENVDLNRPLYAHQEKSIRHIIENKNAVITTGTGSGKTESFLFPILNEILFDIEKGNNEVGVRAIFLYPLNALINDQIERVRSIISNYPQITFGFFTGDTEEKLPKNYREKQKEAGNFIPENELISREEIRQNPPHLLFTNYSMLEYLLIRPNDYKIFSKEKLKNWKFVVLDEAHTYYGSLGIEISVLMRRLTALAPKKPRFILTSATLGQEGKSEKEIANFATNLTSSNFSIEDIIFSKRILPFSYTDIDYEIKGSDYLAINNNLSCIKEVAKKYTMLSSEDELSMLYDLLIHDKNVKHLYELLKRTSKNFKSILKSFNDELSDVEIVALINLLNKARKNNTGIFNLKYHSFIRPISGAYVTFEKNPVLSLTKTNYINGFKAFEIGNCRHCRKPYVIGKIRHNNIDDLDYLFQNDEIDIYENYGENENVRLDYFLTDNKIEINDAEQDERNFLEEYCVCSKCGAIHESENLNAKHCECGEEYQFNLFKVSDKSQNLNSEFFEPIYYNNINFCPGCGNTSHKGLVKTLNLGKDEATALISQILLESMGDSEPNQPKTPKKLSLKKIEHVDLAPMPKIKQFLSFSDSRQQAAFFATFFDATHTRMLQKRLIWDVIQKSGYKDICVDELASALTEIIDKNELFDNKLDAHKNAWVTLLVELLKVDGSFCGEGLGLFHFDLDLSKITDNISDEDVDEVFGEYNVNKKDLENIIQVVFDIFKTTPAINHEVCSRLTPEEKREHLEYRGFSNYITYQLARNSKNNKSRSFLPRIDTSENITIRYIRKVFNCNNSKAREILYIIFNQLGVESGLLEKYGEKNGYQIKVNQYVLKNYKTSKYYKCKKCGKVTPYNVHNVCVKDRCVGTLEEINPDEVLKSNYYRQEYKNKKIEKIVVKEHTAQLKKELAKEYQQQFKNKKINVLSCSTTFEMGVDIGDLETVFMRNVPPTPANYVQRAGRAGRRKDSFAYILTFCSTNSHDYTYFKEPEKMISGIINPPYFNTLNEKIITRHLMAICLGFFFRNYPNYYKSVDALVFENGENDFKDYIKSCPQDLNEYINNKVFPEPCYYEYHNFKWFDRMGGNDKKFEHFMKTMRETKKEYESALKEAQVEQDFELADYYKKQLAELGKKKVIELLSKFCVIPKYGFPVDLVELQVYKNGVMLANKLSDDSYDLTRDLKIAISEYAPDSEIIANKNKLTSKYITLPKTGVFTKHYFCTCENCKKINLFVSNRANQNCKYCGESINDVIAEYFIEPIYGFKTGITKESSKIKPKRTYSGEVLYIGNGINDENLIDISGVITVETSSNDELLIMNKSNFYMCPKCGFSQLARKNVLTPTKEIKHNNYHQFECKETQLQTIKLGHCFQTDVARFTIPYLFSGEKNSYPKALSFMYAFLEGISIALEIERNDIEGIIELNLEKQSYDILIYDNIPGGAGHVKRLANKKAVLESLKISLNKVSQKCCDENTSCYNCLRNYRNQFKHSLLKRIYAKEIITEILNRIDNCNHI